MSLENVSEWVEAGKERNANGTISTRKETKTPGVGRRSPPQVGWKLLHHKTGQRSVILEKKSKCKLTVLSSKPCFPISCPEFVKEKESGRQKERKELPHKPTFEF